MDRKRGRRTLVSALALLILPGLTLAEVSVELDQAGAVKHTFFISRQRGGSTLYWTQVRARVPQTQVLNPLGDARGDSRPFVRVHPVTGAPWVVWGMNVDGVKRIGFAAWQVTGWTVPRPITAGNSFGWDELDPMIAFDGLGTPYVVWWRAEQTPRVYFSTMVNGSWTPPLAIGAQDVEGKSPTISVRGSTAIIRYRTPSGPATAIYDASILIESAANLMDSPIPPGFKPPSDGSPGGNGGSGNGTPPPRR
jgi:hypothetical protein